MVPAERSEAELAGTGLVLRPGQPLQARRIPGRGDEPAAGTPVIAMSAPPSAVSGRESGWYRGASLRP